MREVVLGIAVPLLVERVAFDRVELPAVVEEFECAESPRPRGSAKLAGRSDYRVRVGDWRIVYKVDDDRGRVVVIRIARRSDVYRHL